MAKYRSDSVTVLPSAIPTHTLVLRSKGFHINEKEEPAVDSVQPPQNPVFENLRDVIK